MELKKLKNLHYLVANRRRDNLYLENQRSLKKVHHPLPEVFRQMEDLSSVTLISHQKEELSSAMLKNLSQSLK